MDLFNIENDVFIICSNDIDRVKKTYKFKTKNIVFFSEGEIEDLCMLSLCDHYILSPSTYGWWGCFLNNSDVKKIIMMKPWFNRNSHGNQELDLYFENAIITYLK